MLVGPVHRALCSMPLCVSPNLPSPLTKRPGLIWQVWYRDREARYITPYMVHVTKAASSHLAVAQPACTLVNGAIAGRIRLKRHLAFQTIRIGTPIWIPIRTPIIASVDALPV